MTFGLSGRPLCGERYPQSGMDDWQRKIIAAVKFSRLGKSGAVDYLYLVTEPGLGADQAGSSEKRPATE